MFDESESEVEGKAQERAARLIANAFSVNPYFVRIRDELFEMHGWRDLAERLQALAREGKSQEEMQRCFRMVCVTIAAQMRADRTARWLPS